MENVNLTDTPARTAYFRQGILANLEYWQTWLGTKINDMAALDQERNLIIKAVTFALDLGQAAWPGVYHVIERFSSYMERGGHWSDWRPILNQALHTSQHIQDIEAEVELSVLLAKLSFQQSYFPKTVYHYRRVIRLARKIGDNYNEARACTNLGYHYIQQGQWFRAEVLNCYALEMFEKIQSNHGRAHTENHLGFLYTLQQRWDLAQQHLEKACALWQTEKDQHGLMRGYLNLGGLFVYMEQPIQALDYMQKALHIAQLTGETVEIGTINMNMGIAYRLMKDFQEAEKYNRQAEEIFERYSNLAGLSKVWNGLGLTYGGQGNWSEAFSYLEKSLVVWRKLGIRTEEIEVLLDMGECELQRGNRQQALTQLQQVEHLIGHGQSITRYRHLQPRLEKYRRSLTQ